MISLMLCTALGSSPRVRGKLSRLERIERRGRLIPACAGKTLRESRGRAARQAHPRVCGENASDRVRWQLAFGLIPACAGKTSSFVALMGKTWAHPRVCGENPAGSVRKPSSAGSSPRVRGKPLWQIPTPNPARLIPACAGKTRLRAWTSRDGTAHPRVCGENFPERLSLAVVRGSSPRVRGKPSGVGVGVGLVGLIPACAGKTAAVSCSGCKRRAHPRVCGENCQGEHSLQVYVGSSPRVRGKH